ncbi:hypothetical protein [Lactococcus allomyrinae]|uniref:Lactococcin 972 family bacteriocin n=1 Tax=Lactococcus allomyrinae TaxID=2419773 RepID=A0A387BBR1_9LACT|nr:hypothetical protein [Lactococcus allomyrinae]AYF99857.1 hypothetical protein D7I46_01415 [Lactococcus allomyrinae]
MKNYKKLSIITLLALTGLGTFGTLSVNAATKSKTTTATLGIKGVASMTDHVYFSYTGSKITTSSGSQSVTALIPSVWISKGGIKVIDSSGAWKKLYQGKYTVGVGVNAGSLGHLGVSVGDKYIRTAIQGDGTYGYYSFNG